MAETDASPTTEITDEFARKWVQQFLDAWRSHDPEELVRLTTDNVHWEDPFIYSSGELRGQAAFRDWLRSVWRAFPDIEFEVVGEPMISLDRRRLALEWVGQAHMSGPLDPPGFAPTGALVTLRGVDIHTFRDDLVDHVVTITDVAAVAGQIGAMPPPGSIGEKLGVQVQHLMARRLRKG